jgi:hypothetical protein
MRVTNRENISQGVAGIRAQSRATNHPFVRSVGVVREDRQEPFLEAPHG